MKGDVQTAVFDYSFFAPDVQWRQGPLCSQQDLETWVNMKNELVHSCIRQGNFGKTCTDNIKGQ